MRPGRSLGRTGSDDLVRRSGLAGEVAAGLFARDPCGAGRYAGRLVCRALCRGAALRYLDDKAGARDFDVWSFCAGRGGGPLPYRWRGTADNGPSKVGRCPGDPLSFTGRRVDLPGRSLEVPPDAGPAAVLRGYLSAARTAWASELAANAVVLISPGPLAGTVIWPPGVSRWHAECPRQP